MPTICVKYDPVSTQNVGTQHGVPTSCGSSNFEVWNELNNRLESPQDNHNGVLRRTLGLKRQVAPAAGKSWLIDGVAFANGTEFRMHYRKAVHTARVDDGALLFNGKRFDTPSAAASSITGSQVNGWKAWQCRAPGSSAWIAIDGLRAR